MKEKCDIIGIRDQHEIGVKTGEELAALYDGYV